MRPFNPDSSVLSDLREIFLLAPELDPRLQPLERARPHGSVWLLLLEGAETLDDACRLRGEVVAVPESELPPLRAGEFYHYQLIGLTVVDESGAALGAVSEVVSASGNDVLVVSAEGRERLIPLVDRLVREIDLGAGRIVVQPIDGLLD